MAKDYERKRAEREQYIPVRLFVRDRTLKSEPVEYHGSAHILALSHANGLMKIPVDVHTINKGEECQVKWLFH
jgi:molybdopterin molybdotransferase